MFSHHQQQQQANPPECQDLDPPTTVLPSKKFNFGRCKICKDKATGIHYGIPSCEGCKGFYKRSIDKHDKYVCSFGSKCTIMPRQRRKCKFCRWRSCVKAGMSLEAIKMGRISKNDKEKVKTQIDYGPIGEPINHDLKLQNKDEPTTSSTKITTVATKGVQTMRVASPFSFTTFLLAEKCNSMYLELISDLIPQMQRAQEYLKLNRASPYVVDQLDSSLIQLIWQQCLQNTSELAKSVVFYAKKLPGFAQLDLTDLAALLAEHTVTIISIKMNICYIGGEQFFMLMQNIRVSRSLILRMMGPNMVERIAKFNDRLKAMNLRETEIALLMPFVLSTPDGVEFKQPSAVLELNEIYKSALFNEFDSNNRSSEFVEELIETLKTVPIRAI